MQRCRGSRISYLFFLIWSRVSAFLVTQLGWIWFLEGLGVLPGQASDLLLTELATTSPFLVSRYSKNLASSYSNVSPLEDSGPIKIFEGKMGDGASCWSGTSTLPEGSRSPCSLNFRTPGWTVGGRRQSRAW